MSEQKRYTSQEMRDASERMSGGCDAELVIADADECGIHINRNMSFDVAAMLRQAADTEDENAQLRASKERWMQYQDTAAGERNTCIGELRKKDAEIAQLKARLEAVVRECVAHIPMRCRSQCKIAKDGIPAKSSYSGKPCYKRNVCDLTPEELTQTGTATEILRALTEEAEDDK